MAQLAKARRGEIFRCLAGVLLEITLLISRLAYQVIFAKRPSFGRNLEICQYKKQHTECSQTICK